MKLYLSGPMSNMPNNNEKSFREAAAILRASGYEVVVPHELDAEDPNRTTWIDFLTRDLKLIAEGQFDGIAVLRGWEVSKGAKLEIALALLLGIPVYFYRNCNISRASHADVAIRLSEVL